MKSSVQCLLPLSGSPTQMDHPQSPPPPKSSSFSLLFILFLLLPTLALNILNFASNIRERGALERTIERVERLEGELAQLKALFPHHLEDEDVLLGDEYEMMSPGELEEFYAEDESEEGSGPPPAKGVGGGGRVRRGVPPIRHESYVTTAGATFSRATPTEQLSLYNRMNSQRGPRALVDEGDEEDPHKSQGGLKKNLKSGAYSPNEFRRQHLRYPTGAPTTPTTTSYTRYPAPPPPPTTTFHRSARVPTAQPLSSSLGDGKQGEVIARVLQEAEEDTIAAAYVGGSGAESGMGRRTRGGGGPHPSITSSAITTTYSGGNGGEKKGLRHRKVLPPSSPQEVGVDEEDGGMRIVKAEAWVEAPRPIAAHYSGDVSNYSMSHKDYDGNGRLRNSDGIFRDWKGAGWITPGDFSLSPQGELTIRSPGLYYIYAQIHYLDDHDINGFTLQINGAPFLQCTTMTETGGSAYKSNSCFTGGITMLQDGDKVILKDVENNRYSIFKEEKSFFGLMKVGAVP